MIAAAPDICNARDAAGIFACAFVVAATCRASDVSAAIRGTILSMRATMADRCFGKSKDCDGAGMKTTKEIIEASRQRLRDAYRLYSLAGLRWDFCCNISEDSRQVIREELSRRGCSMERFEALGRGKVQG